MIRLFSIVVPARVFTLFVSEIVLLYACFLAAAFADSDIADVNLFLSYDSGVLRISIVVGLVILGLFFTNLYAEVRLRSRLALLQGLCVTFGAVFIGEGVIGYIDPSWIIPRKMMLAGTVLSMLILFGWRLLLDRAAQHAAPAGQVLFLGMSPVVTKIAGHFDMHPELGLTAMGYLEGSGPAAPGPVARLGTTEDLDSILDRSVPASIVIGNREDVRPWWADEFLALRFGGVRVQEAGMLYERIFARKCLTGIWPASAVFRRVPESAAGDAALQMLYSWTIALIFAAIALPLTLPIAVLIKLGSRGPVLTREKRIGLHDTPFEAFHFRCARLDGTDTAVGRFLQRNRLAWLPQLLNVLKGQMAMVGPRPERPLFSQRMSQLIPVYRLRNRVRPGVTGWARIHRRRGEAQDSVRDLEYDLYYVENRSPLMDLFILLLSLKRVD